MNVVEKLNQIAELEAQLEFYRLQEEEAVEQLLGPSLYQALQELREEFASTRDALSETITELRREVQSEVKELGKSVKGERLQAVYSMRTSWNTRALNGYAAAHPELLEFRRQTPSVSIRSVK